MRAVVFDFSGTPTDPSAGQAVGAVGGAVPVHQAPGVGEPVGDRIAGRSGDTRATLRAMAARCGVTPTCAQLGAAVAASGRPPR